MSSLDTIERSAATRAITPGWASVWPWHTCTIWVAPLHSMPMPTAMSMRPIRVEARVSYLPWPKSWSASQGLPDMRTKSMTTTSVMKSESECTASAIMAALPPTMPATNLNTSSKKFTTLPHSVTRNIWRSRCFSVVALVIVALGVCLGWGQKELCTHAFFIHGCKVNVFMGRVVVRTDAFLMC